MENGVSPLAAEKEKEKKKRSAPKTVHFPTSTYTLLVYVTSSHSGRQVIVTKKMMQLTKAPEKLSKKVQPKGEQ